MMKYCVRRIDTGEFLHLSKGFASWGQLKNAHKFNSEEVVNNFMANNFCSAVRNQMSKDQVEILPCTVGAGIEPTVSPEATITEEQASKYLDQLPELMGNLYETGRVIRVLLCYYSNQVRSADLALEDLLHKIEFTNVGVVDGYKLYKAVQSMRLRRRQYKDICAMLNLVNQSGVVSSLINLKNNFDKFENGMESRKYTPRILDELFQTVSTANIDKTMDEAVGKIFEIKESEGILDEPA